MSEKHVSKYDRDFGRVKAFDVGTGIEWRRGDKIEGFLPWDQVPATMGDISELRREMSDLRPSPLDDPNW